MKFIGGTLVARTLFEDLYRKELLCMPYTDAWMKKNSKKLGWNYRLFCEIRNRRPTDQGLVFIDTSALHGESLKNLIDVLPAFETIFKTDSIINPDCVIINLKTQKMILFGLGRKDQIFALIHADGSFQHVSSQIYYNHINGDFETIGNLGEIAIDPTYRYLQELCGDWFELINNSYNALETFGLANFEYMCLPGSVHEVECLLDEIPNAEGKYELDGEEFSPADLRQMLFDYENLSIKCVKSLAYLQVLFPKMEHSELATGAY